MEKKDINALVCKQREYFLTGQTLPVAKRIESLKRLKASILAHQNEIYEALKTDLGKSNFESYMCEVGLTLSELSYMISHTKRFAKEKVVATPLAHFHSRSYKLPSPYGVVLIMSPWNYPFMLAMEPLVDALAAGNTAIVKPSAYSPSTSEMISKIIDEVFAEEHVAVVTGGRAENTALLDEKFDYIFFTGSQAVGREVMSCAAKNLTPVTLELGGKSPCIVTAKANLKLAAKRIVFGKYLNCGQTCVAPDYLYVDKSIKDELIEAIKKEIILQFGKNDANNLLANPDYGKIINEKHFQRVTSLIDEKKVVFGGRVDENLLKIEPTVIDNVSFDDAIMQQEIFGPLMPILTFDSLEEAVEVINSRQHPLALYIFTNDKKEAKFVTNRCGFGGGCINDTIIHLATSNMGFGGFGESGMGEYHGKTGFDTFSHHKSMVDKKCWLDLPMRYQPYTKLYDKIIHIVLK